MTAVLGLDLSLTATGVALPNGEPKVLTNNLRGCDRLIWIRDVIAFSLDVHAPDLVMVEGYAMGTVRQAHSYATGELGGVVRVMLHEASQPFLDVPPATLKKYATGRGNAKKVEVLQAAWKRLGYEGTSDDEADALWLRAVGMELLGVPVVSLPAVQRAAVDVLRAA